MTSELLLAQSERLYSLADLLEEKAEEFSFCCWDCCVFGFMTHHMGRRATLIDPSFDDEHGEASPILKEDNFQEVLAFYGLPSPNAQIWFYGAGGCRCYECKKEGVHHSPRRAVLVWARAKKGRTRAAEAHGWARMFRLIARLKASKAMTAQRVEAEAEALV